jgi:hypothetical protein
MAGMIQILTYLLAFYLVLKGVEILQIGLASNRPNRGGLIVFGVLALVVCLVAAFGFASWQDSQAMTLSHSMQR